MNVFDLPGPQFLLFYAVLAPAVLAALVLHRRASEAGSGTVLSDPYAIAYLRAGRREAARAAVASLISRGLIRSDPFGLAEGVRPEQAGAPLERAVLSHCAGGTGPRWLANDPAVGEAADALRDGLEAQGLLPDAAVRSARRWRLAFALTILIGTAAIKVGVALDRGRTNVGFLLVMAVAASVAARALAAPRRTRRGDAAVQDVRELLSHLRDPAGGRVLATDEALLVAAAFGLAAVPGTEWRELSRTMGAAPATPSGSSCGTSTSCSTSSASSCGSSGASSCGSGCGGGGGCGGCGS
jgi:uncharacterized protein (TIGR04222 family)